MPTSQPLSANPSACRKFRILLAWELGDNLGHLWRLLPIATRLMQHGHEILFAVRDPALAEQVLGPRGFAFLSCPSPAKPLTLNRDIVSYADILAVQGFGEPHVFGGMLRAWRTLFDLWRPDLVVTEHSPSALVAGRSSSLPTVSVGTGFLIPPKTSPLPCFRPWAKVDARQAADTEAYVLNAINQAYRAHGLQAAPTLAAAITADRELLLTLPELDHYRGAARGPVRYLGPVDNDDNGTPINWQDLGLPCVFAYLRNNQWLHAVLEALADGKAQVIAVIPDLPDALASQYANHPILHIQRRPVRLKPLLPDCALAITSGGHGTSVDCLRHGVPMLLLPNHIEQLMVTTQIANAGVGVGILPESVATKFAEIYASMLANPAFKRRAGEVAAAYRELDVERTLSDVVDVVESLLPRMGQAS